MWKLNRVTNTLYLISALAEGVLCVKYVTMDFEKSGVIFSVSNRGCKSNLNVLPVFEHA